MLPIGTQTAAPVDVRKMLARENSGFSLDAAVRNGTTALTLNPLELIDHLAALIPPPRCHRHRYLRCFSAAHPPAWDDVPEPMPDWDLLNQPEPDVKFDQRVSW